MKKTLVLLVCLTFLATGLHVKMQHQATLGAGRVSLKADTGKYLARCNGCGRAATPDSASLHETNPANPWAIWTLETVGDKVAFKADSGKYLSRCNNCWSSATKPDSAFVHVSATAGNPWAQWTPVDLGNGKWAFKADTGKYLARCTRCVTNGAYPDFAFVQATATTDPAAQWTVEYKFPTGNVNLQADTSAFLARCNNCGPGATADSASLHETNPANPWATWAVEVVGSKVAFKADNGNYLSRCNGCWTGGAYPDSVFVHVPSAASEPAAQWTPENLGNGKWALKADTGKYLSRCNNCVSGGAYPDFAFVHVDKPDGPWAQWTVTTR